jgi:NTE family protein
MKDISLALGGGGMRGIAHIGIVRKLEEEGYRIRAIAGTSVGGVMGAVYASGFSVDEILKEVEGLNQTTLFRRGPNDGPSFMGIQGLQDALTGLIGDRSFDDLHIKFAVTAVDINSGKEIILSQGNVVDAVLATTALPGIFPPVQNNGYTLVDGGVLDPVPVAVARWLAPELPVIAICLSPGMEEDLVALPLQIPMTGPIQSSLIGYLNRFRWGQALQIFAKAIDAEARMLAEMRMQVERPDVIIRPDVGNYGMLEAVNVGELIALGEAAAEAALPDIRHSLNWGKQLARRFEQSEPPGIVLETNAYTEILNET